MAKKKKKEKKKKIQDTEEPSVEIPEYSLDSALHSAKTTETTLQTLLKGVSEGQGFVSPKKYLNYTFEATLTSPNGDDDIIGLIIAFVRIEGVNYFITANRSRGANGNYEPFEGWAVMYEMGSHATTKHWEIKAKDVVIVTVQASKMDGNTLSQWVKKNNIPFPVGMVEGNEANIRFAWAVKSLPWLILADRRNVVIAAGFQLSELDDKIAQNTAEN